MSQGLAVVLGIAVITLLVGLLWLVLTGFPAKGPHGLEILDPPIAIDSRARTRIYGALLIVVGCGLMIWSWCDGQIGGRNWTKMAVAGPTLIGVGMWIVIEAPDLPLDRFSPLGWILSLSGLAIGLFYGVFLKTGCLLFFGW
jgi:hypothetical protein